MGLTPVKVVNKENSLVAALAVNFLNNESEDSMEQVRKKVLRSQFRNYEIAELQKF
jgi:hypothetical protein